MHDIDRTQLEFGYDREGYETESDLFNEMFGETGTGYAGESEGPMDEVEEMEMAAQFLEISSEDEMDQFLDSIVKGVGKFMKSSTGKALKSMLKKAAPVVGGLAGTALGSVVPGLGNILGGAAGSAAGDIAGKIFGLEMEGMSAEDQEFEVARRYVRFATEAANQAAEAPKSLPPEQAAKTAVIEASKKYAPGLLRRGPGAANGKNGYANLRPLGMLYLDARGHLVLMKQ